MTVLIENWPTSAAATLSFAWFALHLFGGGKAIAKPLRQSTTLDHRVMATIWMCWHMVTASIILMGVFFVLGLYVDSTFVVAGSLLAGGVAIAGISAPFALGTTFRVIPQGWLFVPIALLGAYSTLAS